MTKARREKPDEGDARGAPERTCIATREQRPASEMIRFALSPEAVVTPDLAHKLPGRGVWVSASRKAVETAMAKKAFARGFKAEARTPPDLAEAVERLLARHALEALSIANKAGAVILGFAKVESAIAKGNVRAILHATDAGEDGVRKLAGAVRRGSGEGISRIEVLRLFDSAQMDLALGRSNVIHAALGGGGATENFLARSRRLVFYRASAHEGLEQQRNGPAPEAAGIDDTGDHTPDGQGPGN